MPQYAVKVKGRKSRILITAKDGKDAKKWAKKMGLEPVKSEKFYTFTK